MDIKHHTQPHMLERYSFLWSEARLLIAALALFLGGVPPIYFIIRNYSLYGLVTSLLTLCWIISGLASAYLLYRWNQTEQKVFGKKDTMDLTAFFVSVVSGINLGLAGILRRNIGMSIWSGRIIFIIVGLLYLWAAYHLYNKWKSHGDKVF